MPLLDKVLSLVAPHDCVVCGREGALLCRWCITDSILPVPSRCYRCHTLTSEFSVCATCRRHSPLRHVWVATDYDASAKELLHLYKFSRAQTGAKQIAAVMGDLLPFMPPTTLVVYVPTATSRIRERGYDHAALLAREIAKQRQLSWDRAATRLSQTRQVGANRLKRREQLEGAFLVTHHSLVKNADVLIVDDVVTTGATLETLAYELKRAGARAVNAVVFAQKQ